MGITTEALEINNSGIGCDPIPESNPANNHTNSFDGLIPEEYREGVVEVNTWLAEAASENSETLQALLDVTIEYLRLFPQAKIWLWMTMKAWVKNTIWQLFPNYYEVLSSA